MIAKRVAPSRVMLLTRNALGGTSPWSVPPDATFPVGFQLIDQNGLRAPISTWKKDLFLSVMGTDSSTTLVLTSAGAGSFAGLLLTVTGAEFSPAANRTGAVRTDMQMSEENLFIVSQ